MFVTWVASSLSRSANQLHFAELKSSVMWEEYAILDIRHTMSKQEDVTEVEMAMTRFV